MNMYMHIIRFKTSVMNTVFISYTVHIMHYKCICIHYLLRKAKCIAETVAAINQSKTKVFKVRRVQAVLLSEMQENSRPTSVFTLLNTGMALKHHNEAETIQIEY